MVVFKLLFYLSTRLTFFTGPKQVISRLNLPTHRTRSISLSSSSLMSSEYESLPEFIFQCAKKYACLNSIAFFIFYSKDWWIKQIYTKKLLLLSIIFRATAFFKPFPCPAIYYRYQNSFWDGFDKQTLTAT